jgi:hypothetical protein
MTLTAEVDASDSHDAGAAGLTGEEVPLEVLERDLVACAAQVFALEARFLTLIAAFDRRRGWSGVGVRSYAHWLSWRCGINLHAARERVRVARTLEHLPAVAAAFGQGRISYSKVRAITRVATPSDEHTWLDLAEAATATRVERIVAGYRRATTPEPDPSHDPDHGRDPPAPSTAATCPTAGSNSPSC